MESVSIGEPVEIKPTTQRGTPAQIYSNGLEYSFVSPSMEQCHLFVWCKDFLNDIVFGQINNQRASIYGFSWSSKTDPNIGLDKTRIVMVNPDDDKFGDKIPAVLDFVNQIETKLKLIPTTAHPVSNMPGTWYFEGSGRWMLANPMLSFYTLALRVGFVHKAGNDFMTTFDAVRDGRVRPYQSNDRDYVSQGWKGIEAILTKGYRKIFYGDIAKNYPSTKSISSVHNQGIVAFSRGDGLLKSWTKKAFAPDPDPASPLEPAPAS